MEPVEPQPEGRKLFRWLIPALGYAVSLASLAWAFFRFPFAQLGEHLRAMEWQWLALAIIIEFVSFFIDAWRWRELLKPAEQPTTGAVVQSVFAGLFANDLLPARAGEAVRCFLLSFKSGIRLSLVITSQVILRVMDGLWIVLLYFATSFAVESAGTVTSVMVIYAAAVAAVALLLLFALFRRQHAQQYVSNNKWAARFVHFLDEIHKLGNWRELRIVMLWSGLYWLTQVAAVWAIARADNFYFDFPQMTFLLIVKNIGTMVPTAPAGIGAFQATTIYALKHFFTEAPDAKILAELLFGFLTLPGLIGGAIAVANAGYNLKDLVRHAQEAHRKHKEENQ
ncbi:MAG: lysylphosphatidylglycerol synthase transmembrane domain-containing protein [Betaproteobacteria bacterium]